MTLNAYAPFTTAPHPDAGVGFMSGIREARADEMLQQAQQRGLTSMDLGNTYQGLINDRYGQSTPHELDKLSYEAAVARSRNNPNYLASLLSGEQGLHQTQAATGRVDQATAGTKINSTNATNELSTLTSRLMQVRSMGAMNPAYAQAAYQQVIADIKDPQLKSFLPSMFTPEAIDEALNALSMTPAARHAEREGRATRASSEVNNERTNRTNLEIAHINSARAVAVAQLRQFMQNNKQNFQQFLTQYAVKKAAGKATPQDDQMAQMIEQMAYQLRQAGAGSVDPNAPLTDLFGTQPRPTPPSAIPGAQPQPGTPQNPIKLD